MALGKLTFLCLNAVCIGMLTLLVLAALMRLYGEQSPHVRSGHWSNRTAGGYGSRGVQSRTESDTYEVRGESGQRDAEREALYEYDY